MATYYNFIRTLLGIDTVPATSQQSRDSRRPTLRLGLGAPFALLQKACRCIAAPAPILRP